MKIRKTHHLYNKVSNESITYININIYTTETSKKEIYATRKAIIINLNMHSISLQLCEKKLAEGALFLCPLYNRHPWIFHSESPLHANNAI